MPDPFPVLFSEPATYGVYALPKHNVVVLSCMDLRQLDELIAFLSRDNLTNRYDHLVTAGAALGVMHPSKSTWSTTFFEHLDIALQLHHPHDVYIVEHRNCGAYREFIGASFPNEVTDWEEERDVHTQWAKQLRDAIHKRYEGKVDATKGGEQSEQPVKLGVHAFLMDMRGNVERLFSTAPVYAPKKPPSSGSGNATDDESPPPVSPPPPTRSRR